MAHGRRSPPPRRGAGLKGPGPRQWGQQEAKEGAEVRTALPRASAQRGWPGCSVTRPHSGPQRLSSPQTCHKIPPEY